MSPGDEVSPAAASSIKFTYEDFLNFPDDGKRHEIIDGEHYVTPSSSTKHQAVSITLASLLWRRFRTAARPVYFKSSYALTTNPENGINP
jgi:Uma2 family endonuclease